MGSREALDAELAKVKLPPSKELIGRVVTITIPDGGGIIESPTIIVGKVRRIDHSVMFTDIYLDGPTATETYDFLRLSVHDSLSAVFIDWPHEEHGRQVKHFPAELSFD